MLPPPVTSPVCFENSLAVITEEREGAYVQVVWKQTPWTLTAAQVVLNGVLACVQHTGWGKILVKQVPLLSFPVSYHTWLLYDWLPRAQAAGAWCYALIPPHGLFARVGFADFLTQLRQQGACCYVATSQAQAVAWLAEQIPAIKKNI
ncbi:MULTISPECIES: hypothetical protein [Hymenobacter]|uniref:SpoIIAA-like n=1 Tax=Hymenobacter mucosus TaxID=1411120 RepID=A0A239ADS9_9BACT|nr:MULTISPECIES: hypothetical protein [Hymenobacter]SNR93729.1 hypothetical protein SAMN06269173_11210 [Hymenobacter mucosus]